MSTTRRFTSLAATVAIVLAAACSSEGPVAPTPSAPSLAKSGTAAGGGVDTTGAATGAATGGGGHAPKAGLAGPSFTARIDSISNVPLTTYYAAPSTWGVGGYVFESTWMTRLKSTAAPFAVGECLTVTFSTSSTGAYIASDIRTEAPAKCP